jgi:DNA-binding transcriptional ArsR family regulator
MNITSTTTGRSLDHTLAALADPTRRAILERLSRGDARVTDVAGPFSISLNSVSKHIRLLERAGLVHRHVVGREHHLSLDTRPLDDAAAWIERQRTLWQSRLRMLDTILREEDRARARVRKLTTKKTKGRDKR